MDGGSTVGPGDNPRLAVAASGDARVVFIRADSLWSNTYTAAGGWGTATQLEAPAEPIRQLWVGTDGADNTVVLFEVGEDFSALDPLWAKRHIAGSGWQVERMVGVADHYWTVVLDDAGTAYAQWTGRRTTTIGGAHLRGATQVPGSEWSSPVQIDDRPTGVYRVATAMDGLGRPVSTYPQMVEGGMSQFAVHGGEGGWGAPVELGRARAGTWHPDIAANAAGHAIAAWIEGQSPRAALYFEE